MVCDKCGALCPDGEMFCQQCGAELFTMGTDIDNDIENASPEIKDSKKKLSFGKNNSENLIGLEKKKKPKPKIEKEHISDMPAEMPDKPKQPCPVKNRSERANMMLYMKIAGIVLLVLFVIIIIVMITSHLKASEGKRLSDKVPIGRNIDYCIKETGKEFSNTDNPFNIKAVSRFDYIYSSEEPISIDGIQMPKWAVMVCVDREKAISSVEYYDFSILKKGWKGEYSKILFTKDTVSYGMDKKAVDKALGFEPYYVKRTDKDKTTYCYRYHITDNNTGTDRIFNYYVVFSDTNDTVINAYDREIEYVNYVLGIKPED